MMNTFLKKQFFVFALLATSLPAPAAYAQQQVSTLATPQATVRNGSDRQERVAAEPFLRTELFFGADKRTARRSAKKSSAGFSKKKSHRVSPTG